MPDLATLIALIMLLALIVYALTGGADFGGGVWDLMARGPRAKQQRELVVQAIGPIWEANHVWLILVIVLLFVAFPAGFAAILTALHIPIALMLIGITLRGSAFVFRSYGRQRAADFRRWGLLFAIASAFTPITLGVTLGAVSSGALELNESGQVVTDFVSEWLAPFPISVGLMVLFLFSYLAAVYLAYASRDDAELSDDFRSRAIMASVGFGATALVAALLSRSGAPHLWEVLGRGASSVLYQVAVAGLAVGALVALVRRSYAVARILAAAQVVAVVLGWGLSQKGFILVGELTLEDAAAPDSVLGPVLIALVAGMVVLIPSFIFLFRIFRGPGETH
ncbi:MAG: cytochrome d ubiquinol oxidase subunit II [Myxococcales bacterium]|nr:cytochrome d ubiquinol oxidase subunit II [Myxococcales bacterium]